MAKIVVLDKHRFVSETSQRLMQVQSNSFIISFYLNLLTSGS